MIRVTAMNRKRFVGDWAMLGTVFGLILFGLLMIYSASNYTARLHMGNAFYYVERQIFTVLLGTAAMFLMMKLDYHREVRSEEHTSELQSQSTITYAVFCLKKVGPARPGTGAGRAGIGI